MWLVGLLGLAVLAVPLVLVRVLVEDASVRRLATVALSSLVTATLAALVWRTVRPARAVAHGEPAGPLREPVPAWPRKAMVRARRRSVRGALRRALPALVVVLLPFGYVVGERAAQHDADLLRTQPVREAVVTEVRALPTPHGVPDVVVEVDGHEVVLALSYPGSEDAQVGQVLDVVVDPADRTHVLATTSHDDWAYTWWGGIVVWALLGGVWLVLVTRRLPRRQAVRAARTVTTHRPAHVVSTGPDWAVLDDGRERWLWSGQRPAGPQVVLLGDPAPGAWVVLDDGRTRLPHGPLEVATAVDAEPGFRDDEDDGRDDDGPDGWDDDGGDDRRAW